MASATSANVPSFSVTDLRSVFLSAPEALKNNRQELDELLSRVRKTVLNTEKELEAFKTFSAVPREMGLSPMNVMMDHSVIQWSKIKTGESIFTPRRIDVLNHEFWLKITKNPDGIGSFVCHECSMPRMREGIDIHYQFFIKDRHLQAAAIIGQVFTSSFSHGETTAFGLSRLATLEELQKQNAYDPKEDIITVGVRIAPNVGLFPKRGLVPSTAIATPLVTWINTSVPQLLQKVSSILREVLQSPTVNLPEVLCPIVGEYLRGDIIITEPR